MTGPEALLAGSPHPFTRSMEPLVSLRGAGGVTGKKDYRYEPETSSGPDEVFVYYTVEKREGRTRSTFGVRRCRTGITRGE